MSHDVDIQLQVWKDLAISKQILMGAAADALGLDSECSTDELKTALDQAIQRAREADIKIQETLTESEQQITEFNLPRFRCRDQCQGDFIGIRRIGQMLLDRLNIAQQSCTLQSLTTNGSISPVDGTAR